VLESFVLDATSGDLTIEDMRATDVAITTTSGDCKINTIMANTFSYKASSGDSSITQATVLDRLTIHTTSGDTRGAFSGYKVFEAECASGDLKLVLAPQPAYSLHRFKVSSGDIRATVHGFSGSVDLHGNSGSLKASGPGLVFEEVAKGHVKARVGEGKSELFCDTASGDCTFAFA
ncbi:hypothetical protein HDU91_004134, partial [Kappamyces sp. JEL0680]